jgi:hypothetical protein
VTVAVDSAVGRRPTEIGSSLAVAVPDFRRAADGHSAAEVEAGHSEEEVADGRLAAEAVDDHLAAAADEVHPLADSAGGRSAAAAADFVRLQQAAAAAGREMVLQILHAKTDPLLPGGGLSVADSAENALAAVVGRSRSIAVEAAGLHTAAAEMVGSRAGMRLGNLMRRKLRTMM